MGGKKTVCLYSCARCYWCIDYHLEYFITIELQIKKMPKQRKNSWVWVKKGEMLERIQRVLVIFQVALKQKLSVLRRYGTPSYYDVDTFKECNSTQSYGIFFFIILTFKQSQLLGPFSVELKKTFQVLSDRVEKLR